MSTSSLIELPQELLCEIVSHLDPTSDRLVLRNLCLVSKAFTPTAQQLLFSCFSYPDPNKDGSTPGTLDRLVLFTIAALSRLQLRTAVKHVDVSGTEESFDGAVSMDNIRASDLDMLREAAKELPSYDKACWSAEVRKVRSSFLVAVLTSKTPNLDTIILHLSHEDVDLFAELGRLTIGLCFGKTNTSFLNLKVLDLGDTGGANLVELGPLLQLPSLEEFKVTDCVAKTDPTARDVTPMLAPASIKARSMAFRISLMDAASLIALLTACEHLRKFEYNPMEAGLVEYLAEEDCPVPFTLEEMISALQIHSSRLEELHLDFLLTENAGFPSDDCLRRFGLLKHISINKELAHDLKFLPNTLESLTVTRYSIPWFEFYPTEFPGLYLLDQILQAKHQVASLLRKVTIIADNKHDLFGFFDIPESWGEKELIHYAIHWQQHRFLTQGVELRFQVVEGDFESSAVRYMSLEGIGRVQYQERLAEVLYREKRAEAESRHEPPENRRRIGFGLF